MGSKKKKKKIVGETLSKNEKEIWNIYLEDMKRFHERFKNQCIEGYKEITFDYIDHIEYRINEVESMVLDSIVELYKLNELHELEELKSIFTAYQILHALKNFIYKYREINKKEMRTLIYEDIQVGDDSLNDLYLYHYKASDRLIKKFEDYLIKETEKLKKQVYESIIVISEELENELIEIVEIKEKYLDEEINKLLKHINSIPCSIKNINAIMLLNLNEAAVTIIDGLELETISLTLNINQLVDESLGLNELKESLKIELGEGFKSSSDNKPMKLKDGKMIYWNESGLIVNAKDLAKKDYNYKELNKYAEDKGYTQSRCTGDHMIYIKEGYSNIIIPQKKIGRGLQQKILRDLDVV